MKSILWIFWLCLLVFFGCESIQGTYTDKGDSNNMADVMLSDDEKNSPLKFQAGVWVYPRPNTSADRTALELSSGKSTWLADPDGNIWKIGTQKGYVAANFASAGYTQDWFPTSGDNGQLFYCQAFAITPAPVPDPMLESFAYCSVYLDAGDKQLYAWLYREADIIPCPTVAEYKTWLPRATTANFPYVNLP